MAVVENKVSAATTGAGASVVVANFVLWVLGRYVFHDATPEQIVALVNVASASLGAFVLGYFARHTHLTEVVQTVEKDVATAEADVNAAAGIPPVA